jgi:predicted MPP superfamily phosphohydrolase
MDWTDNVSLEDDINEEIELGEKLELIKVRKQRDALSIQNIKLTDKLELIERSLSIVETAEAQTFTVPHWLSPTSPKKSAGTLVVMLSDTHFDEVVDPQEMEGLNAYSREIAVMRLERWAQNVVKLARHYLSGVTYDGVVLILGGDIFTGDIHEELSLTNEDTMIGSLLFWSEQISGVVELLANEFKKCHVVSVVGNHGRTTRKPRMKQRVRTNYDWLVAKMVERQFTKDKRVTFSIPESADALIKIYEHGHLITHGDQVSGGGGIGGIYPPIMRMRARKEGRYLQTGKTFKTMWLGHWHQYISTPSMVVNGSMKGYDEYAMLMGFGFEQPQQALALITPEKNITFQAPVFCIDRKKEGW